MSTPLAAPGHDSHGAHEAYVKVFTGAPRKELDELLTRYPTKMAALLPALWIVQRERGWISEEGIAEVAEVLELTPAYVKGVVTFYTMYHQHPVGKYFMDDVAHDTVLNVSERGDRAVIGKFEGKDLTNVWAGNVVDLCPVGALLSKDFLNKARAWELDRAASICPNCTQGCNVMIETRENQIVRIRPRPNEEVNAFFMCDYGRLNYRWMNERQRAETPLVRSKGKLVAADWEVAVPAAAKLVSGKRAHVIASPMLSNESLFLLTQLIESSKGAGVFRVAEGEESPLPGVKDLALRKERAANVNGAEMLGFKKTNDVLAGAGKSDVIVIVGEDLDGLDASSIANSGEVILIGPAVPEWMAAKASIVLPTTNFAEEEGTVTNLRGRVQRFTQAKAAPGLSRPTWLVLGDLLGAMGKQSEFFLPSDVFTKLASSRREFAGLSYDKLGFKGLPVANAKAGAA